MNITNETGDTKRAHTATATSWTLDASHTTVGFGIRHLMVTTVRGVFERVSGNARYTPGKPETAQIDVTIDAASVSTHDPRRDAHLRDPDFFDVERYPRITFRSTGLRSTSSGAYALSGELTFRGYTRPITLDVHELSGPHRDFRGTRRIGASATAKLRRSDFGIHYNILLEAGGIALADDVSLTFDLNLVEKSAG